MFNTPKITELLDKFNNNTEETLKSTESVVNVNDFYNRHFLIGEIDPDVGDTIEAYIRFFNQMDDQEGLEPSARKPIVLFIDSYGGDMGACFTMIDAIEMSKTPIYTVALGATYSAGFFTFITGHKKFAYPHASFLYHEGSAGTSGTSVQFENFAGFYKKQLAQLKDHTIKHTGIDEDKYKEIQKTDFWMTASEALELGVCDKIITSLDVVQEAAE